jgi:Na+/H+ antiporter NhaA
MSLFVATFALRDSQLQAQAKLAILVASDTLLSRFP